VSGGFGSGWSASGQNQADEMRLNPGTMGKWGKGEKRRMLLALVPFVVVLVLALIFAR
jgi:hypothetical protein